MAFITCPKCKEDNKDTAIMCVNCFATLRKTGQGEADAKTQTPEPPKKTGFLKQLLNRKNLNSQT
ncbi:MAG: hypothetical protein PHF89_03350 [Eubacteriales bacterium]|jgi:hypothetical protein|nr:hypothetical protein [Eubacteriales bacterium]